eukprot:g2579.t1
MGSTRIFAFRHDANNRKGEKGIQLTFKFDGGAQNAGLRHATVFAPSHYSPDFPDGIDIASSPSSLEYCGYGDFDRAQRIVGYEWSRNERAPRRPNCNQPISLSDDISDLAERHSRGEEEKDSADAVNFIDFDWSHSSETIKLMTANWPDKCEMPSGTYFIYIQAKDTCFHHSLCGEGVYGELHITTVNDESRCWWVQNWFIVAIPIWVLMGCCCCCCCVAAVKAKNKKQKNSNAIRPIEEAPVVATVDPVVTAIAPVNSAQPIVKTSPAKPSTTTAAEGSSNVSFNSSNGNASFAMPADMPVATEFSTSSYAATDFSPTGAFGANIPTGSFL